MRTPTPAATPTPSDEQLEAVAAVEAFNPADRASFDRLNDVILDDGDVVPVLALLLEDESLDRR